MNPHEILACVELALYCALLAPIGFCLVHYLPKKQRAWVFLAVFVLAKIVGPAILIHIYETKSTSTGLVVASQILYQVALGPLLSATISFVNTSAPQSQPSSGKYSINNGGSFVLRLVHPIIIVAIVLGIVGATDRIPDSSGSVDPNKYDRGVTFSKVSSVLFILAIVGIAFGVFRLWKMRQNLTPVSYFIVHGMIVVLPLLFVRVIYSVLAAFNLDTTHDLGHTTKFNVMTGSWVIYLFLGLLTQAIIIVVYTACGVLGWMRERQGVSGRMPEDPHGVPLMYQGAFR